MLITSHFTLTVPVLVAIIRPGPISPNTVVLRLAALRFFFIHGLKGGWSIAEGPYLNKVCHLPGVLSQEEVARPIEAADTPFHCILLMTLYATGARRAAVAHFEGHRHRQPADGGSYPGGQRGKDRDVMLSPKLLEELRVSWRGVRRNPKEWLFPATAGKRQVTPASRTPPWPACRWEHPHRLPSTASRNRGTRPARAPARPRPRHRSKP